MVLKMLQSLLLSLIMKDVNFLGSHVARMSETKTEYHFRDNIILRFVLLTLTRAMLLSESLKELICQEGQYSCVRPCSSNGHINTKTYILVVGKFFIRRGGK